MSPRPKDRLLADQALFHPWIRIEDESDLDPIFDVEESPVTPCDGDEQIQHTQASAAWTQETAKSMENSADQSSGRFQEPKDEDGSVTIRMGKNSIVANTTVTTKNDAEKQLSDSGRHPKIEERGERPRIYLRPAEPVKDDYSHFKEPPKTKSDSEASDAHEKTPTSTTYMEDADEDGNPIEGTKVYAGTRRRQPQILNNSGSRKEFCERNEMKLHSRPRSPSPVGDEQQTLRQATQDRESYKRNGYYEHPIKTGLSSYAKVVVQCADPRDHYQIGRYLDTLTFEFCKSSKIPNREL